jgi:hypothetical protein
MLSALGVAYIFSRFPVRFYCKILVYYVKMYMQSLFNDKTSHHVKICLLYLFRVGSYSDQYINGLYNGLV